MHPRFLPLPALPRAALVLLGPSFVRVSIACLASIASGAFGTFGCTSVLGADFDHGADGGTSDDGDDGAAGDPGSRDGSTSGSTTSGSNGSSSGGTTTVSDSGTTSTGTKTTGTTTDAGDGTTGFPVTTANDAGMANCSNGPTTGDFEVVELMIESTSSNDHGEWAEIRNISSCTLSLLGLSISSPHEGESNEDTLTIDQAVFVGPGERFLVVDSIDSAVNHGLTGVMFAWNNGGTLDDSDTIIISTNGDVASSRILQWDYTFPNCTANEPGFCYTTGHSVAFPDACPTAKHDVNPSKWSAVTAESYANLDGGSLYGTPNAVNPGVCP